MGGEGKALPTAITGITSDRSVVPKQWCLMPCGFSPSLCLRDIV